MDYIKHKKEGIYMAADIIAFANNKGGVTKTTTCVNLGAYLSKQGKRVLLIDLDPQGNVATSFGHDPDQFEKNIIHVLLDDINPNEAIYNVQPNLDILPSNQTMENFTQAVILKGVMQPYLLVKQKLEPLKAQYDVILIDCPPALGYITGNAMAFANGVIIPFLPEAYPMRSLSKTIGAIRDVQTNFNSDLRILGVLPTMIDNRTNAHKDVCKVVEPYLAEVGTLFFDTQILKTIKYANAVIYENKPIILVGDKEIENIFRNFTKEIIERNGLNMEKIV